MNKRYIACMTAGVLMTSVIPFSASAVETHNVTVVDFNGSVMKNLTVPHGSELDLSVIDTSVLDRHLDIYTQIAFNSWGNLPESNKVTEDIVVYALFRKMVIACESFPEKTEYFADKGSINLKGLKVTITDYVQTPEKDKNGNFIVTQEVTNIESKCTTVPSSLDNAFADGRTSATIDVYPINSDLPILSYDITCLKDLGDIDGDNMIESADASLILMHYSKISVGNNSDFTEHQKNCADIDRDGTVDSADASLLLAYYSMISTSTKPVTWEDFFNQ